MPGSVFLLGHDGFTHHGCITYNQTFSVSIFHRRYRPCLMIMIIMNIWVFPQNTGTPKWMVKIMVQNPMNKWMIWGETPLFLVQHPSATLPFRPATGTRIVTRDWWNFYTSTVGWRCQKVETGFQLKVETSGDGFKHC